MLPFIEIKAKKGVIFLLAAEVGHAFRKGCELLFGGNSLNG